MVSYFSWENHGIFRKRWELYKQNPWEIDGTLGDSRKIILPPSNTFMFRLCFVYDYVWKLGGRTKSECLQARGEVPLKLMPCFFS